MARTFDGAGDRLTVSIGLTGFVMGPGTAAAIVKRGADGAIHSIFHAGAATSGANRWMLRMDAANKIDLATPTAVAAATLTVTVANGWSLIAASKASGTSTPRFHRYIFSTNVWSHEDGASTLADSGTPITTSCMGEQASGSGDYNGDIAIAGIWNVVLTDTQIESLAFSLQAWFQVQPKGLWLLDQAATTHKVADLTGGGARESALTGTTVATSAVPVFSYGHPIDPHY